MEHGQAFSTGLSKVLQLDKILRDFVLESSNIVAALENRTDRLIFKTRDFIDLLTVTVEVR